MRMMPAAPARDRNVLKRFETVSIAVADMIGGTSAGGLRN